LLSVIAFLCGPANKNVVKIAQTQSRKRAQPVADKVGWRRYSRPDLLSHAGGGFITLGTILVIILIIFLLGGFSGRFGGYGYGFGHGGMGIVGVVLVIFSSCSCWARFELAPVPLEI
jgi:hypothetical protein